MLGPDVLPVVRDAVREQTQRDRRLLDDLRADVRKLVGGVSPIRPRTTTSVSIVASDGGNNRLEFDPFSIQLVRVVDSYGRDFLLDAVSPTTDTDELSARQFTSSGDPGTALGCLMKDLGVHTLHALSPMIPAGHKVRDEPWSVPGSWVMVYRDLCEWAVLYKRIVEGGFATDTLIVRDGLLRSKVFAGDLFVRMGRLIADAMEGLNAKERRKVFLVGVAKHSRVIERYRLAMLVEDTLPAGEPLHVRIPRDIEAKVYTWPEYARGLESSGDGELPKFVLGDLHLVRFGPRSGDPVWPVDIFTPHGEKAAEVFGYLLSDAVDGFPVPYYPRCLQRAHEHAQVAGFDLRILQDQVREAVRDLLPEHKRPTLDASVLADADPAASRYG